ncbi:unnamed protein product [Symbiodinium sp. CCMP2592]|nr:unnamed protein product [Symbiodinium sp. CCMP2592]CAE7241460.1 unnamed protein product [Symbiodinium sp. CCMP2592]CAE7252963.1 unnamed protein product [Symbiodinium sp. CCMP2592]
MCDVAVVTAPCVSFSRFLGNTSKPAAAAPECLHCRAICVLFRYGKQEGFANREQRDVHWAALQLQRKTPIHIHENVNSYAEVGASVHSKSQTLVLYMLSPKLFGIPNNRDRTYRILYDTTKKRWGQDLSLQELADLMLAERGVRLPIDYSCWAVANPNDIRAVYGIANVDKTHLHLRFFEEDAPDSTVYDLSCNSKKRKRVENKDGSLQCLTTGCHFWMKDKKRLLLGKEKLHVLGYPCWGPGAQTAKVDPVDMSDFSESALDKMAGNGMTLACCGFVWLMAVLCLEEKLLANIRGNLGLNDCSWNRCIAGPATAIMNLRPPADEWM